MCSSPHHQNERPVLVLGVLYIFAEYIGNFNLARGVRMLNTRNPHTIPMFGDEPLLRIQWVDVLTPFQRNIDCPKNPRRLRAYIFMQSMRLQDGLP